jgi:site-specific DNA recombinase
MTQAIATKAGIRYRYYLSLPCLHGAAKTAKIGSVTRVPATDIEDVVVKSLNEHLRSERGMQDSAITGHSAIAEVIDRIDVHRDRLEVHLRSRESPETTKPADDVQGPTGDCPLFIPWQKPPSKRFRQILLPHGSSRTEVRPGRLERRLRLVSAIARGRRWLDEILSGSVTDAEQPLSEAASAFLAEHYRMHAEVCHQMALATVDLKEGWLQFAEEWRKLAQETEANAALEQQ